MVTGPHLPICPPRDPARPLSAGPSILLGTLAEATKTPVYPRIVYGAKRVP
jgi:hypothetical protein